MIRPLRRWHRWIWPVLAIGIGALYFAALAVRPPRPRMERLPASVGASADAGAAPGGER